MWPQKTNLILSCAGATSVNLHIKMTRLSMMLLRKKTMALVCMMATLSWNALSRSSMPRKELTLHLKRLLKVTRAYYWVTQICSKRQVFLHMFSNHLSNNGMTPVMTWWTWHTVLRKSSDYRLKEVTIPNCLKSASAMWFANLQKEHWKRSKPSKQAKPIKVEYSELTLKASMWRQCKQNGIV